MKMHLGRTGRWVVCLGLILTAAAIVDVLALWQPWKTEEAIVWEMDLCSVDGQTTSLAMDGAMVDNGIDPVYFMTAHCGSARHGTWIT